MRLLIIAVMWTPFKLMVIFLNDDLILDEYLLCLVHKLIPLTMNPLIGYAFDDQICAWCKMLDIGDKGNSDSHYLLQ